MRRMAAARPVIESVNIPAPIGGLNTIAAGSSMPATDCVQLYNMVAAEYGLRSRFGSREWVTGCTGLADNQIRTMLPFTGSAKNGAQDKVFAVTSTGIWDVTASSATPSQVVVFPIQSGDAGKGICHGYVNAAGHWLLYCDEENGYHTYSEASGTWTVVALGGGATEISGVDPAGFAFVMSWKSRLWFVAKDTADVWYLAAGAIYGAATKLSIKAQFRAGGPIIGLWNWTLDGGIGIDDYLVAVSGGGDVAVYKGSDPSSATTFSLNGTWSAGAVPAGRHIASNFGGDLLLLTKSGIRPLSQLVSGGEGSGTYLTAKIANLFNARMLDRSELPGWAIHLHPEDNALIVTVPTTDGANCEQLTFSLWNKSWSSYRDLPLYCACVFGKKLYMGDVDGRVLINDGYIDGVTLADPNAFTVIQWALLTAFQNLGSARMKKVEMLRPTLLCEGSAPTYDVRAKYRYDFSELAPVTDVVPPGGASAWDAAIWDSSVWGGDYQASQSARGAAGMGVDVAVAIRGTAKSRTVLVGFDVMFQQGGLL